MKKKPIYMYVLLVLSSIGTMLTFQSFFGESKVTLTDEMAAALNLTTALEKKRICILPRKAHPRLTRSGRLAPAISVDWSFNGCSLLLIG